MTIDMMKEKKDFKTFTKQYSLSSCICRCNLYTYIDRNLQP